VSSVFDTVDALDHRRVRYGRDVIQHSPPQKLEKHRIGVVVAQFKISPTDLKCQQKMLAEISELSRVCSQSKPRLSIISRVVIQVLACLRLFICCASRLPDCRLLLVSLGCAATARVGSNFDELMQIWASKISEASGFHFKADRSWCSSDLGLINTPGVTRMWMFAAQEGLLAQAVKVYDAVLEKFTAAMWSSPQRMQAYLFSRAEYEARAMVKKAAVPKAAAVAPVAGEGPEERSAKRQKLHPAADLASVVDLAKSAGLLHKSFQAPADWPKPLKKLAAAGASASSLAIGWGVIEKASLAPEGTVVLCLSKKASPGCIQLDAFPNRCLAQDDTLAVSGKKPKLRPLLPAEVMAMKLWPADACNLSMLCGRAQFQAAQDCLPLVGIAAAIFGMAAAVQSQATEPI
jgi:hypothetical protein